MMLHPFRALIVVRSSGRVYKNRDVEPRNDSLGILWAEPSITMFIMYKRLVKAKSRAESTSINKYLVSK